ncbi:hypothetical protein V1477_007112 [Vespula maculifrons]|uniref:Uncharacterized protein n=1 Tax=Vespula maculifrons TaxID=7453 RepID=A0ABD2CHN4_VESMC
MPSTISRAKARIIGALFASIFVDDRNHRLHGQASFISSASVTPMFLLKHR